MGQGSRCRSNGFEVVTHWAIESCTQWVRFRGQALTMTTVPFAQARRKIMTFSIGSFNSRILDSDPLR